MVAACSGAAKVIQTRLIYNYEDGLRLRPGLRLSKDLRLRFETGIKALGLRLELRLEAKMLRNLSISKPHPQHLQ